MNALNGMMAPPDPDAALIGEWVRETHLATKPLNKKRAAARTASERAAIDAEIKALQDAWHDKAWPTLHEGWLRANALHNRTRNLHHQWYLKHGRMHGTDDLPLDGSY